MVLFLSETCCKEKIHEGHCNRSWYFGVVGQDVMIDSAVPTSPNTKNSQESEKIPADPYADTWCPRLQMTNGEVAEVGFQCVFVTLLWGIIIYWVTRP